MTLTENEQRFFLWLGVAFAGVMVWLFQQFVVYVKSIAKSVQNMEKDLGVLTNDHTNLKEEVKEIKDRLNVARI